MPYNNLNVLKRIAEMQDAVRNHQDDHPGLPLICIYRNYIKEQFHISYSTFTRWLGIPAKREIEKKQASKSN
jgi:hypothetical protein